ncbi:GAF domain-containing protein [Sulfurimonas aquatica]|uniref:GAF domain-containing protein n=1 Tax=Sulfurimonas aquatica TaxID=2672570 RepID=A0A975AY89_9BACT|nr:GAF domain-containing protein [Sulfurimonas aquatica]QSZ40690.1 GAF domain-containing protein [Sulfurimonas aquatica]
MNKLNQIGEFGKELMTSTNIDETLAIIATEAKRLANADRCSIFIVDEEDDVLWSILSDGIGRIVVALNAGIVGDTYTTQEAQIVNKPYEEERFLQNIDKKSGYITKNMITVPIFNSRQEVMGIIQLLNKADGDFTEFDKETFTFFANYVSGSLELLLMQE